MKYASVFITLCIIIIIICAAGIGFIFYQQNPNRYYLKGISSYNSGNYDSAIESLNEYLSYGFLNEKSQNARYYLAAAVDRKRGLSADTASSEVSDSVKMENIELSKQRYLTVINNNDKGNYYTEAIIGYADICRRNNEYDRFITSKLEDSLRSKPDSKLEDTMHMLLGYQYLLIGEYTKAMNEFLQSASELSKLGQARTHVKLNQYESAFKIYEDFLNFFPSSIYIAKVQETYHKQVMFHADQLRKENKNLEAILFYKRIIAHFPDTQAGESARISAGECYYALEKYDLAKDYFLDAISDTASEKDDLAHYNAGLAFYELGKFVDAYKYFNELINRFPSSIYITRSQQWVRQLKKDLEYFSE